MLGTAYEPYIFSALNSAKVMVVVGTKPENFNAVWVKNEWSRYLALIKGGAKKILIPAYRDMDAYDLPDEFSHLQAQDMSKLGFMQDLIRGIKKVIDAEFPKSAATEIVKSVSPSNGSAAALLKRAYIFLEDGDFAQAREYFNRVLDSEPENAAAYVGLLCAEMKVKRQEELANANLPLNGKTYYKNAVRFADEAYKMVLQTYDKTIVGRMKNNKLEKKLKKRNRIKWVL